MEIFIGNLPFDLTKQELIDTFVQFGEIGNVKMMFDCQKRFRGIAYVEFVEDSCARVAVSEMNGKELKGRAMKVDYARALRPRFNGFGRGFGRKERRRPFRKPREDSQEQQTASKIIKNAPKYRIID